MKLYEEIKNKAWGLGILKENIPEYIQKNLKFDFFQWQKEALESFFTYEKIWEREEKTGAKHLMFNMATGTGKTLIMASLLLYYYKQGYRNFIFFVNQNNIVSKTENNFLDCYHTKYLFNEKIIVDEKEIKIKKVENFSSDQSSDIEIKFTTIQKLYNDIHTEKENNITLEDLNSRDIVMLADEAHHLNSATKKGNLSLYAPEIITEKTKNEDVENFCWEQTITNYILHKNKGLTKNRNVLLEFTATIPANAAVEEKYRDKIVYKFDLKDFLQKGYTKEINLISSTYNKKDRILHALLMNWYRNIVGIRNGISNFKPVILFRSKTIEDSKNDFEEFKEIVLNISLKDFEFLKNIEKISLSNSVHEQGKARTEKVLNYLNGDFSEVVKFIKNNFKETNVIITNSKINKTKKEKTDKEIEDLLNNLEDTDNHIRAIFTVERLTEGWDVLNLYDIVRLYEGQNTGGGTKKTPEATTKEKQLIGRGVRYFPFGYRDYERNKRKFDNSLENEMRVLEELFFYTYDEDSKYISHLKKELREDGFITDGKIRREFNLKPEFKKSYFYKNIKIIGNELKENTKTRKMKLKDLEESFMKEYKVKSLSISEDTMFLNGNSKGTHTEIAERDNQFTVKILDFEKHIFKKALNIKINSEPNRFGFDILKKKLKIKSYDDLQKEEYLGKFKITIISPFISFNEIYNKEKLQILLDFFTELFTILEKGFSDEIGGEFNKFYSFEEIFGEGKIKVIDKNDIEKSESLDEKLKNEKWYVLDSFVGTSEEREVMKFVSQTINQLKNKYSEVVVVRNEEIYKIYDFKNGRGFQPDFLMFLQVKDKKEYYQLFIEPKGENLREHDKWKEEFLQEITEKYKNKNMFKYETDKYYLIGLPFYTKSCEEIFKVGYEKLY